MENRKSSTGSFPSAKAGMSTLDLLGGTPAVNRVVRFMLQKNRMTYQELCDAVDQLPENKRLSRADLDAALEELINREWLSREGEGAQAIYQVVLRPKVSSAEQFHTDNLPEVEVAKDVNPHLDASVKRNEGGLGGFFRGLFGGKK